MLLKVVIASQEKETCKMHTPYTIILAPNPSMMSGPGTNTIVLGSGAEGTTIIDPAVDDIAYLDALIKEGSQRGTIRRILITHGHPDHIGGALALKERLGVAIYAFSREGVPMADREIADGATFPAGDDTLRAIHTPGHRFDHLCYLLDYLNTLKRLQEMEIAEMVPSHGPPISDPQAKLAEYIEHRMQREEQVILALEELPRGSTIAQIVPLIYMDVDPRLHPVAARTVEAHLLKLEREGLVERLGEDAWALVQPTA